ncbi:unnamed protein product [Victoria cruziana]
MEKGDGGDGEIDDILLPRNSLIEVGLVDNTYGLATRILKKKKLKINVDRPAVRERYQKLREEMKVRDQEDKECPIGTYKVADGSKPSLCTPCSLDSLPNRAIFLYVRGASGFSADGPAI